MSQLIVSAASAVVGPGASTIGSFLARTAVTTAGAYAAGYAQRLIFGPAKRRVEGARLDQLRIQSSEEGAPIMRAYGRVRLAGQIIWAANFKESVSTATQSSGGKGGRPAAQTTTRRYQYSLSFAVGLCEGVIDRIGRVWADGKPVDLSAYNIRIYKGEEDQTPDPLIEIIEGADAAPAYRGLAYIVFEDLPLEKFGNRIPQLSFEIERSLKDTDANALENSLTAVSLIPGSGEFVLGSTIVRREEGEGVIAAENAHNIVGGADLTTSIEALIQSAPNLKAISIICSWFADGVDAGTATLRPKVEVAQKTTSPYEWQVAGINRGEATIVSMLNGAPAFGGTPADQSVTEAISYIKSKGLKVMFHPFVLVDAPGFPLARAH